VVHAGGPEVAGDLVEAYLAAGPVSRGEVEAALPTMILFRWAVYADHFARRLRAAAGAGAADPDGADRRGLDAARAALARLGADPL
jgi:hypothetical protein